MQISGSEREDQMDRFTEDLAQTTVGLMIGSAATMFLVGVWTIGILAQLMAKDKQFAQMGGPIGDVERDTEQERQRRQSEEISKAYRRHMDEDWEGGPWNDRK